MRENKIETKSIIFNSDIVGMTEFHSEVRDLLVYFEQYCKNNKELTINYSNCYKNIY